MYTKKRPAYAKINSFLYITGKRPDGYHDLCTLMHRISLHDTVAVTIAPSESSAHRITIASRDKRIPADARNTAYAAARHFLDAASLPAAFDINIEIIKRIPKNAGLGGGSSDAAAALLILHEYFRNALTRDGLMEAAAKSGADVPFFIAAEMAASDAKHCAKQPVNPVQAYNIADNCAQSERPTQNRLHFAVLCEGIGERTFPVPMFTDGYSVLIAKPASGISTKAAFEAIDSAIPERRFDRFALVSALRRRSFDAIIPMIYNDFTCHAVSSDSRIEAVHAALGPLPHALTGSGSAFFAPIAGHSLAEPALSRLAGVCEFAGVFELL